MTHQIGSGPVEARYREQLRAVAEAIDDFLNPDRKESDRKTGFVVLMFAFGEQIGGRMNYISNANREDIVIALREQLAYFSGAPDGTTGKA